MADSQQPPSTPSWQERSRRLREDAVLDAAAELMAERGFVATSMDDVAARVGISKPTLYQHFPSKDAVAQAVVLRNLTSAETRLGATEAALADGERVRPRLERHLREAISLHGGLWATRAQVPPAVRDAPHLRALRERVWNCYGRLIDRCKAEGDCRSDVPTALLVRHVVRVFRGDYVDLIEDGTVTLDALADTLVSLLFDGMAPREPVDDGPVPTARRSAARRTARRAAGLAALALGAHVARAQVPAVPNTPGAPATLAAAAGRPLTLADVLDAALRANPTARAAVADARAASERYAAARGSWLPTVTFAPGFLASQSAGGQTGATTGAALARQRVTFNPSVDLSYLLFDLGGRAGTVGAARETATAAGFTRDLTMQGTLLQAEQAYFGFQGARAVVAAQEENVRTAGASRDAAVGRFRAGLATVADTLQTATALAQARVSAVIERTTLSNARATLATTMGARADAPFTIAVEAAPDAASVQAATAVLAASVDTLVAHALGNRPDVGEAGAFAAAADQRVRVARSGLLPSVQLGAAAGRTLANQSTLTGNSFSLQLGLALPLFDGGTRHADLDAARADADAARARAEAVSTGVVNQVVSSAEALRLAAEQLATSDALLASAVASEAVARGRYTEGVGSIVDLVTAQGALATARAQAAQARWNWATALAELSRNAGILGARGQLPAVAAPAVPPTVLPAGPVVPVVPFVPNTSSLHR